MNWKRLSTFHQTSFEYNFETEKQKHLSKLIKQYWYSYPSALLRNIITEIIVENNLGNLKFINDLIKNNSNSDESKKIINFFAIKN